MDATITTVLESIATAVGAIVVTGIGIYGSQLMAILRLRTAMKVSEVVTKSIEQTNKNDAPEVKKALAANMTQALLSGTGMQNLSLVVPAFNEGKVFELAKTNPAASGPTIDEIPRG